MWRSMMGMAVAMAALSGCHGGSDGALAMIDEFRTNVDELRGLNRDHAAETQTASDMPAMMGMESAHRDRMRAAADRLAATADRLGRCERLCCTDATSMLAGITREMEHHGEASERAADVARAGEEEARHQAETDADLDELDGDHAQMMRKMGMGMDMGCPAESEAR